MGDMKPKEFKRLIDELFRKHLVLDMDIRTGTKTGHIKDVDKFIDELKILFSCVKVDL